MPLKRVYSEDEVRGILDRALRHDASRGIAHEDLLAAARDVGISEEALEIAMREADEHRGELELREAILAQRRRGFRGHLTSYLAVNGFLVALNALIIFLSGAFVPWALFPILGWGLGLFFHGRAAYSAEISERELRRERERREKAQRKLERERRKAEEDAERRARREKLEQNAAELGKAVEEGVSDLLGAIAKEIGGSSRSHAGDEIATGPSKKERSKDRKQRKKERRARFEPELRGEGATTMRVRDAESRGSDESELDAEAEADAEAEHDAARARSEPRHR